MKNLLIAINIAPEGGFKGIGPLGLTESTSQEAPLVFNKILNMAVGIMTVVAFIWFTFQLILGAISLMTSGGDKNKLTEAKSKITTSLIGLVIVIAAVFLIKLIGTIFGIDWILNPAVLIYQFASI